MANIRSQSLLEIGANSATKNRSSSHPPNLRSFSSSGLVENPSDCRRRNTLTKLKDLVIPEVEGKDGSKALSPPPWKQENGDNGFPKYSPAFKRKPITVYDGSKESPSSSSSPKNNSPVVKSDDSDNDSAVSSGRSSLSHSSVSPPNSPKSNGKTRTEPISESEENNNPRVLKKDSIEAINRKNILQSCKKSSATMNSPWNGKPASRSSSFTIAERKKSFEMITSTRTLGEKVNTHSSQDSLSRKSSRDCDSAFTSRRPSSNSEYPTSSSRRGSETLAETIKDIETRVAQMSESVLRSNGVGDDKWSTLEKKYSKTEKSNERPKDLVFGPRKSSLTTPSPGSKTIKELAERWESRTSLVSEGKTPTEATAKVLEPKTSFFLPSESEEWESFDPSDSSLTSMSTPTHSNNKSADAGRKYSVPIYSDVVDAAGNSQNGVKMRENKKNNTVPSRPSSLIETGAGTELKVFEMGHLGDHPGRHISASTSRGSSQADLLDCSTTSNTPKSPLPGSSSRELLDVFSNSRTEVPTGKCK